jgi:predicted transcriptional regulator
MSVAFDQSAAVKRTAEIVEAYVSNNHVAPSEIPTLIANVHRQVCALSGGAAMAAAPEAADIERPTAAEIRRSIREDGIMSFIDGRSYKTLKRHLTAHGLTPSRYKEMYGLPTDYPMVAPSYSAQRSALAKDIGLGRPGAQAHRAAA